MQQQQCLIKGATEFGLCHRHYRGGGQGTANKWKQFNFHMYKLITSNRPLWSEKCLLIEPVSFALNSSNYIHLNHLSGTFPHLYKSPTELVASTTFQLPDSTELTLMLTYMFLGQYTQKKESAFIIKRIINSISPYIGIPTKASQSGSYRIG